jgi:hypothetical protein
MKFRIYKRKIEVVDTEYELPLYLYFQGELMEQEFYKITENSVIKLSFNFFGGKIETMEEFIGEDRNYKDDITTKEHFDEAYNSIIGTINEILA